MSKLYALWGILRNIFWPYGIFKRNAEGETLRAFAGGNTFTPVEAPIPTFISRILSLLAGLIALSASIGTLTGRNIAEWIQFFLAP